MSESNRRQAYMPQGARIIENPHGTAPAFIVEDEQGTVIVLPGVPHEMRFLFAHAVLPYLRDERGVRDVILVRTLHATGTGESVIGEQIADLMQSTNPTVGISAKQARYELRIGAKADSIAAAEAMLTAVETTLRERLGDTLLGEESLDKQVGELLTERGLTLALYEGHLNAPVYRALSTSISAVGCLRGVLIHPLDAPVDEAATAALALNGAGSVRDRWRSDLALGMQVASQPNSTGFTAVCIALVFAGDRTTTTHHYDLAQPENWDFVGTLALNVLRRYLLGSAV